MSAFVGVLIAGCVDIQPGVLAMAMAVVRLGELDVLVMRVIAMAQLEPGRELMRLGNVLP